MTGSSSTWRPRPTPRCSARTPSPPTDVGSKPEPGGKPIYQLARADLAVFNAEVWDLILDLEALDGLQRELSPQEPRRKEILRALSRALDVLDYENIAGTATDARAELTDVLSRPAHASAHQLSAVGHAHIDSAWLWPLRETRRKVARTVSNVATLAQEYPELVFAFSQAQQHAWVKDNYPEVWERLKKAVADGTIVPVGGMWVESDTNLPGGEALARQFVHGKRFFLDEFGIDTQEVWLPDSFGYTAALPQLVKLSGSKWFLTQKISWNKENKFPHHTFCWEGIDGTRVFTHFPPIDTYNSDLSGRGARARAAQLRRERRRDPLAGPVRVRRRRWRPHPRDRRDRPPGGQPGVLAAGDDRVPDRVLQPRPRRSTRTPRSGRASSTWRSTARTYTSQAKTKQGNRRSEHLLREAELWSAAAVVAGAGHYPYEELDRIWKAVLLHQFHDILPGSSIAWVHREAEATYAKLAEELEAIIATAQQALAGEGRRRSSSTRRRTPAAAWPVCGAGVAVGEGQAVTIDDGVLDNGVIRVDGRRARPDHLAVRRGGRPRGDRPGQPRATCCSCTWTSRTSGTPGTSTRSTRTTSATSPRSTASTSAPSRASPRSWSSGPSTGSSVTQTLRLRPGAKRLDIETTIDWHETEKFLKAAFPVDVHADRSAVRDPVRPHLPADPHEHLVGRGQVRDRGHRWVHVGEPGYGVAVVNDSTYGHDVTRTAREDGGTTTTIRRRLVRAPRFPDPEADQGVHRFTYALVLGAGIADAVEEGYRINLPERVVTGAAGIDPIVAVDNGDVIVEAVKLADDESGDVVVRLYESSGGRSRATLTPGFAAGTVTEVDLLERHLADRELKDGGVSFELRPFQILTLRFTRN